MKARLKNYRQSPRKVRLVADLVRGKAVDRALLLLGNTPKHATNQIAKLIKSAAANAKLEGGGGEKDLIVKDISVDKGVTLKRIRPVSRGAAHPIRKRTSNVTLVLDKKK